MENLAVFVQAQNLFFFLFCFSNFKPTFWFYQPFIIKTAYPYHLPTQWLNQKTSQFQPVCYFYHVYIYCHWLYANLFILKKDEVALYDRQIRLWGMEAQTRLRNSKVLVINVGALANEIIKNIVLAGIGSLTILDANTVTESDLGAQFFLEESDVGKNVCLRRSYCH